MEEEEETTKKTCRKRKPQKDLSPDTEERVESDEKIEIEEEKKPKKRGRKKKKKDPEFPEEELTDLDRIYRVVESLRTAPSAPAFIERPDDTMYGMSDYYEVITKPMWFKEVAHKYSTGQYTSPTEVAADVRLMLENCYHYWGPCDTLSKRALKLEQLFENKLAALPEHLQKLCSLEATHGDIVKEESDDASTSKGNKKGGFVSKLLNWVMNGKDRSGEGDHEKSITSQEVLNKAKKELRAAAEKELTVWEDEHLFTAGVKEQIASMWEFPVIGQFLHLVYNVLNIDPISHLELERMLLMPQASKTLATLITSMLIPPLFRAKLEGGPAMPYSVWASKLNTKVGSWYRSYHSKGDSTVEVFDSLGIEPQFWLVMGEENPLDHLEFHELTFLQRVWLLKGLCDFLLHNHKTIQDRINNLETEELREMKLGKDKDGYTYHYFPNFSEVRIYKMAKVPDTKWKNYESGVEEAITMCAEEEDDEDKDQENNLISGGFRPPRSMRPSHSEFKLVCQSLEDVRRLVDEFCDADPQILQGEGPNASLVAALKSIISDLEPREAKMELAVFRIRNKMKNEWQALQKRSPDFVDPGIAYWERKEKEEKFGVGEEKPGNLNFDMGIPGTSSNVQNEEGKRERRTRRESSLKLLSQEENGLDDESEEESPLDFDDDSEDEWFASKKEKEIKKKREKKIMSAKKMKKLADISDKMQQSRDSDKSSILSTSSSQSVAKSSSTSTSNSEPPVKIKEELPDPDDPSSSKNSTVSKSTTHQQQSSTENSLPKKQFISVKKEFMEGSQPNAMTASVTSTSHSVLQTLVPPVNASNVKMEKSLKPIAPDLSKVKRSNSPDADVVYISDSEDSPDIKPNVKLLSQPKNVETINYVVPLQQQQQPVGNYLAPNQGQFLPVNVAQPQVYQPTQPMAYQMQPAQSIVQQPIIRPNPTIVRLQASPTRPNIAQNQKFVVLQPNANNTNQANQFVNKGPRAQNNFPTTPTMQNVNWFGGRGASPRSNATYSPRQRGQAMVGVLPNQSPRGRGSPRGSPVTPPRGGGVQRFTVRTPTNSNSMMRTPTQVGPRTPSPMRGRPPSTPVGQGPVRNLNFNRSPVKPISKPVNDFPPVNDTPDIEGTLVVSMTDTGGFGYAVMLADGGKISLTPDQLAKIRSDNGGTLPKRCKVPLNMQTEGFRID